MRLVSSKMCMLKDIGQNDNLFGGNMLKWVDEISAIYAHMTTKEKRMVTLKFDEMVFKKPVKLGNIVEFYCGNSVIGTSSIRFDIEGKIDEEIVFRTTAVFVAVDENGNKKEIDKN